MTFMNYFLQAVNRLLGDHINEYKIHTRKVKEKLCKGCWTTSVGSDRCSHKVNCAYSLWDSAYTFPMVLLEILLTDSLPCSDCSARCHLNLMMTVETQAYWIYCSSLSK